MKKMSNFEILMEVNSMLVVFFINLVIDINLSLIPAWKFSSFRIFTKDGRIFIILREK